MLVETGQRGELVNPHCEESGVRCGAPGRELLTKFTIDAVDGGSDFCVKIYDLPTPSFVLEILPLNCLGRYELGADQDQVTLRIEPNVTSCPHSPHFNVLLPVRIVDRKISSVLALGDRGHHL